MSENLYIRSHRYTNPEYRDEYDRIFKEKSDNKDLDRDIQTEMEKGKVTGHFV
jgi:hypothetical protein